MANETGGHELGWRPAEEYYTNVHWSAPAVATKVLYASENFVAGVSAPTVFTYRDKFFVLSPIWRQRVRIPQEGMFDSEAAAILAWELEHGK